MLVDSHAHLDDPALAPDIEAVVARAREAGVAWIVTVGTDAASSRRARDLAERFDCLLFSPGIHPHEADHPAPMDEIRELARHPRAAAVGETGLDYAKNRATPANQRELFVKHLAVALETGKPVSIHCREAHGDTLAVLRDHAPLRGVIHCFSGTPEDAEHYAALGLHLSIAGPVTFPKAHQLRAALRSIPLDRLLVETDCPYLAPQSHRGKRNEPAFVRDTAAEIARVLGMQEEEVAEATSRNARTLFGLQP